MIRDYKKEIEAEFDKAYDQTLPLKQRKLHTHKGYYLIRELDYISKFNQRQIRSKKEIFESLIYFSNSKHYSTNIVNYLTWMLQHYYPTSDILNTELNKAIQNEKYEIAGQITSLKKLNIDHMPSEYY